ncbi:hypothetical protein O3M35_013053 [Rhynocoris fuscipes]
MRTNSQERSCTQSTMSRSKKSNPYVSTLLETRVKQAQRLLLNDSDANLLNAFHNRSHLHCPFSSGHYTCDRKDSNSLDKNYSALAYCKDYVDNLCDVEDEQESVMKEDLYPIYELSEGSDSEESNKWEGSPEIFVDHETANSKNQYAKSEGEPEIILPFESTEKKSYAKSEGVPEITLVYERIKGNSSAKAEDMPEPFLPQEITEAKCYPKLEGDPEETNMESSEKMEDLPETSVSNESLRTKIYAKSEGDPGRIVAYERANTKSFAKAEDGFETSVAHGKSKKKSYAKSESKLGRIKANDRTKIKNYAKSEGEPEIIMPYERSKMKSFSKLENRPEKPLICEGTQTENSVKTEVIKETSLSLGITKAGNSAAKENRLKTLLAHETTNVDDYDEIGKRSEISMSMSSYAESEDIAEILEPAEIRKEGSLTVNYQSVKQCCSNCTLESDECFAEEVEDPMENDETYVQMEELGLGFWKDGQWTPTDVIAQTIWKQLEDRMPEGTIIAKWNRPSKTFPKFQQKEIIKC